jgi:3-deoxy-7-phosphoheptulonate synthase
MIIIMRTDATLEQVAMVMAKVESFGFRAHIAHGVERKVIGAVGKGQPVERNIFLQFPGVERTEAVSTPYPLASRQFSQLDTVFGLDGVPVGGNEVVIFAGPCSVENRSQLIETANAVKEAGAHALRGGAYKPRTSPYAFQGLGVEGLELLAEARQITGLPVITEVMSCEQIPLVGQFADVLQIGARNMQNFPLLRAAGESGQPILLKRGMMATIEELLMAAEYILAAGNQRVMLCERGIRSFDTATRNTTDINAIPVLKSLTHLPVILDPSHSTGFSEFVIPVARAGIAAGADGLIVEVHQRPCDALSDARQSLTPEKFYAMVHQVKAVAQAIGRSVADPRLLQGCYKGLQFRNSPIPQVPV